MKNYEAIAILNAELDAEAIKAMIEKIGAVVTNNGGTLGSIDEWGKRRLAYPINFKTEGYYVLLNFQCEPGLPAELERNLRIFEEVLRYIIVAKDE